MNNVDLSKPTRQSVKGLLIIFIQSIRQGIRMFWALIAVVVLQKNILDNKYLIGIVLLIILALLIVHTILYYLNFYFYVEGGEFILKKGYLHKKILTIPIERIQSVNTKQNLLQQFLDVLTLEIDTAGTVAKELKIHALEKQYADRLNELLSKGKTENFSKDSEETEEFSKKNEQQVMALSPSDLFKIGISQNHIRAGLIIIAFGMQIFNQIQDLFREKADEYSGEFVNFLSGSSLVLIIFLIIFFLLVSILFSLFRTMFKYFDFKLLKSEQALRVQSGLINKRNVLMPYNKIQELNWETGPIKQIFGIYSLVFKQAVSGQNRRNQLVDAPGCLENHLELLKTDLFGEEILNKSPRIFSDKYYLRRLWLIYGWLPSLALTPFFYAEWIFWVAAPVWLILTAIYAILILRKRYFRINNNQVRISKGAIVHKWKQMELYKIQSVKFRQTIFQKRRALASLQLTNAAGSMTIPYINELVAKKIYDYLLFHAETSEKSWM
ncbi:MAG: PH domain-containing protein [Prolixibacteraceae bacterium]|nr:PH domain-containing protein [Prolixibacteraceae bacterium]MBN2774205.1 PH domain-containing protein [Prolixibacteraceae bacterium]